jgi:hypothetical protein
MRFWPLLADHAQAINGKLYVMGGGWNVIGPDLAPFALAGIIELDWNESNQPHRVTAELLTEDGQLVLVPTPTGNQPAIVALTVEVGRPVGVRAGTPLNVPIAINLGGVPIPPDGRYVWRFSINGQSRDDWRLSFSTRPAQTAGPAAMPPSASAS